MGQCIFIWEFKYGEMFFKKRDHNNVKKKVAYKKWMVIAFISVVAVVISIYFFYDSRTLNIDELDFCG